MIVKMHTVLKSSEKWEGKIVRIESIQSIGMKVRC